MMVSKGTRRRRSTASRPCSDDRELAVAAADGDPLAKRRLVERVLDRTRRTVGYLVGPDRDVDDMAQIALVQILKAAGSYRGECAIEYWADRITVRTVMREVRRRRRGERLASETSMPQSKTPAANETLELTRVRERLIEMLGKLSPERRIAVILHHVQDRGIREIAELTGAPINTVRDRLRVGRKQLRKRILADPGLREWLGSRVR